MDPDLSVTLNFAEDMDQTVQPLPADFVLSCDDVVKTIDTVTWVGARELAIDYSEVALAPTIVALRYSTKSSLFLSLLDELITPFDLIITAP